MHCDRRVARREPRGRAGLAAAKSRPKPSGVIWAVFKRTVREGAAITGIEDLRERMKAERWAIEAGLCARLVASRPDRVRAVIAARGGYTKYYCADSDMLRSLNALCGGSNGKNRVTSKTQQSV